ncbi:hypothetical protein niasHT_007246 [Heterodera trifolii]|uniref:CDP-diacylglycerol--inositol 3-phosphatidyltransferase n=1 Tax=Heterodera trifolii TaxID=157864 RepID=A0ABD2LLH0_9BILA
MLDQLTDRLTFLGVLMTLCHYYPTKVLFFQFVAFLDIAAHWMHLHATDLTGKETHKGSKNPILNVYYTSKACLFWMCFGNELFYGLLFVNHFWAGPGLLGIHFVPLLACAVCPVALAKSAINVLHLVTASQTVAEHDREKRGYLLQQSAEEEKKDI